MPERHEVQQIQYCTVMGFRKETIKNRNSALSRSISMKVYTKPDKNSTCNRSSKSRAASPFNSEQLLENRRMVFLPNTGICRYLSHQNNSWLLHTPLETQKTSYRRSNSSKRPDGRVSTILNRWINNDRQSPNSNSCIRSTTNS
jgi:hypothetical protein